MEAAPGPGKLTSDPGTARTLPQNPRDFGVYRSAFYVFLPFLVPLFVLLGHFLGGIGTFFPLLVVFGIVPILDLVIGTDPYNPPEEQLKVLSERRLFRWVTWSYVPTQTVLLLWGAWQVSAGRLTGLEQVGLTLSIGVCTGAIGITFAHELCHKTNRLEQTLGRILLAMVCYMHFAIEHNLGHHVNVATPRDPATSRLGESFYRFYPRTVVGSFVSAWRLEARRLSRSGRPIWSPHNQMIWFVVLPVLLAAALGAFFGAAAVLYFFVQSIVAFSLLEIVNYVEHYGLERREIAPGRYEKVTPLHSWNSNNRVTNDFLIMLQRHSDHHANPQRRYQTLRHFDESPQLPTGYAGMILLAAIPPLWRKVMDPRVKEFRQRLEALRRDDHD